ncbi:MAG: glycosyltransferase family 2 protein [Anaerolineales bacterium]|jgi:glycosyltransferase involved in cell wall biosynthesis|nr:glycosyltransferase family 2 protein [Anaerolineales bacterium]
MRCSIVIRAYNEARHIGRLLDGIMQQTIQDVEIIVVDSGSTDGTVEIASRYPTRLVHIAPQEFTFGRSLNRGLQAANSDLVVIVSAHVYPVYPDWLERLLAPFADAQVGLVYGKQRGAPTTKFSERQIFAHWFPEQSQPRQAHPFCNNANAAIRRSLWEQQPYDETLTGLEDLAWAKAIQDAGHAIAYVAEAEVIHVHQETPRGVYNRYRREAMAFKRIFPKEAFSFFDFLRLSVGNILSDAWHAARQGVLLASLSSIVWFRLAQFWGAYQGHRHPSPVTEQLRQTFYYPRNLREHSDASRRDVQPIQYE